MDYIHWGNIHASGVGDGTPEARSGPMAVRVSEQTNTSASESHLTTGSDSDAPTQLFAYLRG
jgi:hypothetical protein